MGPSKKNLDMDESPFRSHVLDETNYSYWEIRIQVYAQSLDEKAWHSIVYEYKVPTVSENEIENMKRGGYYKF